MIWVFFCAESNIAFNSRIFSQFLLLSQCNIYSQERLLSLICIVINILRHFIKSRHSTKCYTKPWFAAFAEFQSHHFMGNRWGNSGNSVRLYFLSSKITADDVCSHEIKRCLLLGRKVMTNLDSIFFQKQRHYFANKGPSSQCYGFSCGHEWMW